MHRYTKDDVRKAFERYQELAGDTQASLHIWSPGDRYGTRFEVQNSLTSLDRRRTMCGAEAAWTAIHAYCDGYQDALRRPIRLGLSIESGIVQVRGEERNFELHVFDKNTYDVADDATRAEMDAEQTIVESLPEVIAEV